MSDPNQVRINELARELEVKARAVLDYLPEIGVTDKKTHSSSIDLHHAELVRKHFATGQADAPEQTEKVQNASAAPVVPTVVPPAAATPHVPKRPVVSVPSAPVVSRPSSAP